MNDVVPFYPSARHVGEVEVNTLDETAAVQSHHNRVPQMVMLVKAAENVRVVPVVGVFEYRHVLPQAKVREGFGTGKNPVRVAGGSTRTKAKGLEPDVFHPFFQLFVQIEGELLGGRVVARVFSSQQQNGHFTCRSQKYLASGSVCNALVVNNSNPGNEKGGSLKYQPGFHLSLT